MPCRKGKKISNEVFSCLIKHSAYQTQRVWGLQIRVPIESYSGRSPLHISGTCACAQPFPADCAGALAAVYNPVPYGDRLCAFLYRFLSLSPLHYFTVLWSVHTHGRIRILPPSPVHRNRTHALVRNKEKTIAPIHTSAVGFVRRCILANIVSKQRRICRAQLQGSTHTSTAAVTADGFH